MRKYYRVRILWLPHKFISPDKPPEVLVTKDFRWRWMAKLYAFAAYTAPNISVTGMTIVEETTVEK